MATNREDRSGKAIDLTRLHNDNVVRIHSAAPDHDPDDAAASAAAAQALMAYASEPPMNDGPDEPEASSAPPRTQRGGISRTLSLRLYTSHFLSTWNSRLFEFGAVLFLASIYPGTLRPLSIYALVRSGAGIVFAQSVGSWIDTGNRLVVVRTSIVGQRVAVAASCALFWVLQAKGGDGLGMRARDGLFALTIILACVEKLCSMMNLVSVERDWVRGVMPAGCWLRI